MIGISDGQHRWFSEKETIWMTSKMTITTKSPIEKSHFLTHFRVKKWLFLYFSRALYLQIESCKVLNLTFDTPSFVKLDFSLTLVLHLKTSKIINDRTFTTSLKVFTSNGCHEGNFLAQSSFIFREK